MIRSVSITSVATAAPAPTVITPPTSAPSRAEPNATPSTSPQIANTAAAPRERWRVPSAAAMPMNRTTGSTASSSLPIP